MSLNKDLKKSSNIISKALEKYLTDAKNKISSSIPTKLEISRIKTGLEETRKSLSKTMVKKYDYKFLTAILMLSFLASFTVARIIKFLRLEYKTIVFYKNVREMKLRPISMDVIQRITAHITLLNNIRKIINTIKRFINRSLKWRTSKEGLGNFDEIYVQMESLYEDVVETKTK
jgi:hypothetical protein